MLQRITGDPDMAGSSKAQAGGREQFACELHSEKTQTFTPFHFFGWDFQKEIKKKKN